MDEEKYQKELFEFEKPKKAFPRLSDLFPKADFENRIAITLTLERVVFIAIGLIMVMVVIYALGVEAGKRAADTASSETRISLVKPPQIPVTVNPAANITPARQLMPQQAQKTAAGSPVITAPKAMPGKPYTIFAASFSRQEYATLAVNKMKGAGFDAFMVPSGKLFRLCVGSYPNAQIAQKDLLKVKHIYIDAFVKTR